MSNSIKSPISLFLSDRIESSRFNYRDIAIICGYTTPDIIYMFMRGEAKVPLDIVPQLAQILECDAAQLFVLALEQYFQPATFRELNDLFLDGLTENERGWVSLIREVSEGADPAITPARKRRVSAAFR